MSVDGTHTANAVLGFSEDPSAPLFLDDPYEGELMALFMDLLANWSRYEDGGAKEKKWIWRRKQRKLSSVDYEHEDGSLLVQEGFWFSSHEQWKFIVLPYMDLPLPRRVFKNGERVRVHHSAKNSIPGIFASATPPMGTTCDTAYSKGYCGATGIQALGKRRVLFESSVSPYGAFPVILADRGAGLAWYNAMLMMPRMQTPFGSTESTNVNGTSIAPILTWDAKVTTVLAILGGTGDLIRQRMDRDGLFDRFSDTVTHMYASEFDDLPSEQEDEAVRYSMPSSAVIPRGKHFPTCGCGQMQKMMYRKP